MDLLRPCFRRILGEADGKLPPWILDGFRRALGARGFRDARFGGGSVRRRIPAAAAEFPSIRIRLRRVEKTRLPPLRVGPHSRKGPSRAAGVARRFPPRR